MFLNHIHIWSCSKHCIFVEVQKFIWKLQEKVSKCVYNCTPFFCRPAGWGSECATCTVTLKCSGPSELCLLILTILQIPGFTTVSVNICIVCTSMHIEKNEKFLNTVVPEISIIIKAHVPSYSPSNTVIQVWRYWTVTHINYCFKCTGFDKQ